MFQIKEENKTSGKELNKREMSNLPEKEFKVTVIKMLTKFKRRMTNSEKINKEIENIRKHQA